MNKTERMSIFRMFVAIHMNARMSVEGTLAYSVDLGLSSWTGFLMIIEYE